MLGGGAQRPASRDRTWFWVALFVSAALHADVVVGLIVLEALERRRPPPSRTAVELVDVESLPPVVRDLLRPPEPPETKGQIVDLPAPRSPERARDDARYRADHDHRADEETAARDTAIAPKVLADRFLGGGEAQRRPGPPRPDAGADGPDRATLLDALGRRGEPAAADLLSDPFGMRVRPSEPGARPEVPGSGGAGGEAFDPGTALAMAGAPNNDYLPDVRAGDSTQLNAKKHRFAGFWNRVLKHVEPYWVRRVRQARIAGLERRDYQTVIDLVLERNGKVAVVTLRRSCGIDAWDRAVLDAFAEAAPFLNPPEQLVSADGLVRMEEIGFIVSLTGGQLVHMYGDPRAGKMFPGIDEGGGPVPR